MSTSQHITAPLEFYFDFLSPFGYFASLRIDALAARHGRVVAWKPILLGITVLKVMGMKPIFDTPLKGAYIRHEAERYLRLHGLKLKRALVTPTMNPLPAARLFAWLSEHLPHHAKPFARAAYDAYWQGNIDICTPETLAPVARTAGIPDAEFARALKDPEAAALLRNAVDGAIAKGVFGSPFFIVDDEPFFGVDKLEHLDAWLAKAPYAVAPHDVTAV